MSTLHRLAAFTTDPTGGNPAGVHLSQQLPAAAEMQRIAAAVGYSETAFLTPQDSGERQWAVRYFSPAAEVDFCGHATIASGVLLAQIHGTGPLTLHSNVGPIQVDTGSNADGPHATLTSVTPRVQPLEETLTSALLALFGWTSADLHPSHPVSVAFAGVHHPVLVLSSRSLLAGMDYPYATLRELMIQHGWTTIQLAVPTATGYACRDPFPVGDVVEDPATGAAAAAFGAYLRHHGLAAPPADVLLVQGEDMGRRSELRVHIPAGSGGIAVSGHATNIVTDE